jgi:hypothetical protein
VRGAPTMVARNCVMVAPVPRCRGPARVAWSSQPGRAGPRSGRRGPPRRARALRVPPSTGGSARQRTGETCAARSPARDRGRARRARPVGRRPEQSPRSPRTRRACQARPIGSDPGNASSNGSRRGGEGRNRQPWRRRGLSGPSRT